MAISFALFLLIEFFVIMRGGKDVGSFVKIKFCSVSIKYYNKSLFSILDEYRTDCNSPFCN